jgi:hypothetical protein
MQKKVKEKELSQIQKMRLESPKLPGERPGAYDRRLWANFKATRLFEAEKLKSLNEKKERAPKDFLGKLIEKVFIEPIQFVEKIINKILDTIFLQSFDAANSSIVYFDKDDERKGINGYLQVKNDKGVIVLFAKLLVIKKVIACLNLPTAKANKAKKFFDIITACGTATLVVTLPATISALLLLVPLYGNSSPENEETTYNNLYNGVIALMANFQNFANLNPTLAVSAIKQGGFDVRVVTPRKKQPLTAKNNVVQGVVDLTAGGGPARSCHEWKISYDGVIFNYHSTTIKASCQMSGFAGGIEVWFLHQLITEAGPQGFDGVLQLTIAR